MLANSVEDLPDMPFSCKVMINENHLRQQRLVGPVFI